MQEIRNSLLDPSTMQSLKLNHYKIQRAIGNNLLTKCQLTEDYLSQLKNSVKAAGIDFYFATEDIVRIDNLLFREVELKTFFSKDLDFLHITTGYLVENQKTKNCFGVF